MNKMSAYDRYMSKIRIPKKLVKTASGKYKLVPDRSKCWIWKGNAPARPDGDPYGFFWYEGKTRLAHRVGWLFEHGDYPPDGLYVCHKCDVRLCQNPDHWFAGTAGDNHRDKLRKGRDRYSSGDRHWNVKISDADVAEARSRFVGTRGQISALAREYGVNRETMRGILRRTERIR